jgi:hypothetical protein
VTEDGFSPRWHTGRLVSACCRAVLSVQGKTTRTYICTGCGLPCDVALETDDE